MNTEQAIIIEIIKNKQNEHERASKFSTNSAKFRSRCALITNKYHYLCPKYHSNTVMWALLLIIIMLPNFIGLSICACFEMQIAGFVI